jgi:hypothetical protein
MNVEVFTMHIEKPAGTIKQHGFHLGTDINIAKQLVFERLQADTEIVSIALRRGENFCEIYDFRHVQQNNMLKFCHEHAAELVSVIGNLFTQAECKDAKSRLPRRPENVTLWGILNDAELGDFIDWPGATAMG